MAEAVWETLKRYKIEDWIMAIMADNVSNNDSMINEIVALAREDEKAIELNAQWVRMRCMLHTVHLAALKVCSSIPLSVLINVFFFSFWKGSAPSLLLKGGRQGLAADIIRLLWQSHSGLMVKKIPRQLAMKMNKIVVRTYFSVLRRHVLMFRPNIPITSHHSFEKLSA